MPVPTLIIGLGGTGLKALLMIKERLIEAYGQMPEEVHLLELDTDNYPADDKRGSFNGIKLTLKGDKKWNNITQQFDDMEDEAVEFYHIKTQNENMVITKEVLDRDGKEWDFIDSDRISRTISAGEDQIISKGARTIRPLSKLALYLDYDNTINKIKKHTDWLNNQGAVLDKDGRPIASGRIFVLGSAAGGSGAGLVIDILKILGDFCSGSKALPTSCLLAGGQNFVKEEKLARTFSNTFGVLREVERLGAMSKLFLPGQVPARFYTPKKEIINKFEPASEVIVFDIPDRLSRERIDHGGSYLDQVVVPAMADYVTVLMDKSVSAQMSSFKADFPQIFPPDVNHQREYTYFGVGIHSLIFPERDVRKSAGFKLLKEIWGNCLVRDEKIEKRDQGGTELDEPTKSIVEEHKKIVQEKLVPHVLAQIGFQRSTVVGDVVNNPFIKLVATSSVHGKIQIPSTFFQFLTRQSILERIFNLVGSPSKFGEMDEDTKAQLSENFAKVFDDTIENGLVPLNSRKEVDNWRQVNWGPGPLGSEDMDKGAWMKIIRDDSYIQGHKSEFMSLLGQVVKVILNDRGPEGIMSYRLEYVHRMFDELERLAKRWIQSEDRRSASLLSEAEWFKKDHIKFQDKVNKASKATNDNTYKNNVEAAAKIRRNLVSFYLLEELCKLLLEAIHNWQSELSTWRAHLRNVLTEIQTEESKHEEYRKAKNNIKVRTYITDTDFEKKLYQNHRDAALSSFREKVKWTYEIGEETRKGYDAGTGTENNITNQVPVVWLEDSVFAKSILDNPNWSTEYRKELQEKLRLTASELATRAIKWACTDKGNENRPDAGSAFSNLANLDEVKMGDRICDYFGAGSGSKVGDVLTDEKLIATLCPIKDWKNEKMIYMSCVPMHDISNNDARKQGFYLALDKELKGQAARYIRNRNYNFNTESDNKRQAFGMEMAVLWQLKDLSNYDKYAKSYTDDDRKRQALHCMPEEKLASLYEVIINYAATKEGELKNELFGDLDITSTVRLVPEIVDMLNSRERLELFAQAFACNMINNKYKAGEDFFDLTDWYLYPGPESSTRYRLSKMGETNDIGSVLSDLVPDANQQAAIIGGQSGKKILNRVRFWYALRTFMLGERDLDNTKRSLPYEKLQAEADKYIKALNDKTPDDVYNDSIELFKKWYLEHKDAGGNLIVLAHLGLLMMAVSNDLKLKKLKH